MIKLKLPMPCSVNLMRRYNFAFRKIHEQWTRDADSMVLGYKQLAGITRITGPFRALLTVSNKSSGDLDNYIKQAIDYAVRIEVVPDDSRKYMKEITAKRGEIEGCLLELYPY